MPLYDFYCEPCELKAFDVYQPLATTTPTIPCGLCRGEMRKVLAVPAVIKGMSEHFNKATGQPVSNARDFGDQLKRKNDEMSERLKFDVNYQPVDMRDKEALGVTEEGLDATRRQAVKDGKLEVKKHFA